MRNSAAAGTAAAPAQQQPEREPRGAHGPIRRLAGDEIDAWFLGRLAAMWPGSSEQTWRGKLAGYGMSNDYLCIRNDRAVLIAQRRLSPLSGKWLVDVLLCWSRDGDGDADGSGGWLPSSYAGPVLALYNFCRQWLTDMRGERIVAGMCDDLRGDLLMKLMPQERRAPLVELKPRTGSQYDRANH